MEQQDMHNKMDFKHTGPNGQQSLNDSCSAPEVSVGAARDNSPKNYFEMYMADVKKSPIPSPESLITMSREAYSHRYEIMKVLSFFPPCTQALSTQYQNHVEKKLLHSNYVTGICDQSVAARDAQYKLNQLNGKGETPDTNVGEERAALCLQVLSDLCVKFSEAEFSETRCEHNSLRVDLSNTYLFIALRFDEYERHCALFEEMTGEFLEFAELLFQWQDSEEYARLLREITTDDIERISQSLPFKEKPAFRSKGRSILHRITSIGINLDEAIRLRLRYDYHKAQQCEQVNHIVQGNLLLSAGQTLKKRTTVSGLFDACQEANEGLMTAAYRYSYWKGFAFSTYAIPWIRQRLLRRREHSANVWSIPIAITNRSVDIARARNVLAGDRGGADVTSSAIANYLGVDIAKIDEAIAAYSPAVTSPELLETIIADEDDASSTATEEALRLVIRKALNTLTTKKRRVCEMRWGIGYPKNYTLAEVSREMSLTKERVRRIEMESCEAIRQGPYAEDLHSFISAG